ncbi:MAG: UvrD-helicase domain-containing protein [Candidatus Egerieousia sp.]
MIELFSASAGAGKTHRLTGEYIKRLFIGEAQYRHILAVTFTNKATEEMKSRILNELYIIASGRESRFMQELLPLVGGSQQKLRARARVILSQILHDYSLFNVSTIDRFFQSVMRAFARELGKMVSYGVELDEKSIRLAAIDRIYADLGKQENAKLLGWMTEFAKEVVAEGEGWNIKDKIADLSSEVNNEGYKLLQRNAGAAYGNLNGNEVQDLKVRVKKIRALFIKRLKEIGNNGVAHMSALGHSPSEYKGGFRSPFCRFEKMAKGEMQDGDSAKFKAIYNNKSEWVSKENNPDDFYSNDLNNDIKDFIDLCDTLPLFRTAEAILQRINQFGILNNIQREIQTICREQNVMLLADTTELLNRIIDGNDTPFIYEKIGTQLNYIMLDEFQDTSRMQWQNFEPLIAEIESRTPHKNGFGNVVVGDIKQSIYRWRNSDWQILHNFATGPIGKYSKSISLDTNWRSLQNIITFNNSFFESAAKELDNKFASNSSGNLTPIAEIYKTIAQQYPKEKSSIPAEGYVEVRIYDKVPKGTKETKGTDAKMRPYQATVEAIKDALCRGYSYSHITILVRKNTEGAAIAKHLLENNIPVVSSDSMLLVSSKVIRGLVERLAAIATSAPAPADTDKELCNMPLLQLVQHIIHNELPDEAKADMAYLNAFMDVVLKFTSEEGSNLSLFLKWWSENGTSYSISAPKSNAVTICTIHKSKGLEAEIIIIPFFTCKLEPEVNGIIWCSTTDPEIGYNQPLPVLYSAKLENTLFKEDYYKEKHNCYIDAINLAYVACTRPRNELYIFADKSARSFNNSMASLLATFVNAPDKVPFVKDSSGIDPSQKCDIYKFGVKNQRHECKMLAAASSVGSSAAASAPVLQADALMLLAPIKQTGRNRLAASQSSINEGDDSIRNKGVILHEIFSFIKNKRDIPDAVKRATLLGIVNKESFADLLTATAPTIEDVIAQLISQIDHLHWFDDSAQILNEQEILSGDDTITRPDRVILLPDGKGAHKAIVVDYKFGEYDPNSTQLKRYHSQVAGYMSSLCKMGFVDVSGYIWYPLHNKIIEVVPCKQKTLL